MNHEQTEAWLQDHLKPWRVGLGYVLDEAAMSEVIRLVWTAGHNHGFREGGTHTIATFDAAMGKGVGT